MGNENQSSPSNEGLGGCLVLFVLASIFLGGDFILFGAIAIGLVAVAETNDIIGAVIFALIFFLVLRSCHGG